MPGSLPAKKRRRLPPTLERLLKGGGQLGDVARFTLVLVVMVGVGIWATIDLTRGYGLISSLRYTPEQMERNRAGLEIQARRGAARQLFLSGSGLEFRVVCTDRLFLRFDDLEKQEYRFYVERVEHWQPYPQAGPDCYRSP